MDISTAQALVLGLGLYTGLGVLVALPFVLRGAGRVDPGAERAPWSFRLLILPGAVALWPLVARWWLRARRREGP
ncbi:MAG TPA: hypothetical protein PK413_01420 [Thermoanaerobaculia bacterium]|nr:hypothetical protein [Thermoanaerobaculia bacterium]